MSAAERVIFKLTLGMFKKIYKYIFSRLSHKQCLVQKTPTRSTSKKVPDIITLLYTTNLQIHLRGKETYGITEHLFMS